MPLFLQHTPDLHEHFLVSILDMYWHHGTPQPACCFALCNSRCSVLKSVQQRLVEVHVQDDRYVQFSKTLDSPFIDVHECQSLTAGRQATAASAKQCCR